jgi:hypothetical protein
MNVIAPVSIGRRISAPLWLVLTDPATRRRYDPAVQSAGLFRPSVTVACIKPAPKEVREG